MSATDQTRVAKIVDVTESRLIAVLDSREGEFPMVEIDGQQVLVGQLGSYMIVRQLGLQVVVMVTRAYQEERGLHMDPDGAMRGSPEKLSNRGMLSLIPLGQLSEDQVFTRGVIDFPTPGAAVHYILPAQLDLLFQKHQAKQYEIGVLPSLTSKGVCLDPSTLFSRHLALLGQSGSGKSWGVTTIIQKAVETMPNAHIILLDLHGEYVWKDDSGQYHSAFELDQMNHFDARELEVPYWLLTYSELIDLLIDPNDDKAPTQKAFLREVLLALRKKSNKDLQGVQISIDTPVYFSMIELYHQFKRANEQTTDFGKVKGPLYGQFDEFLIKMQSRFNDVRYDFMFKPEKRKDSASLVGLLEEFVGLGERKVPITVIDFSSVPFDVRPLLSAQVGRLAFEFNYWNPRSDEFPICLVCEEAHNYIPRAAGSQYDGARRSMERIAKEGRKYGVSLAVVSQRPHEVSETVLAQCGNFICFRVTNPDDQNYIRGLVPDAESDLVNILSTLGRGEVLALGEAIPIPTRIRLHRPNPAPHSSDVDYYEQWKGGARDLDVSAIVNRWRRQGR